MESAGPSRIGGLQSTHLVTMPTLGLVTAAFLLIVTMMLGRLILTMATKNLHPQLKARRPMWRQGRIRFVNILHEKNYERIIVDRLFAQLQISDQRSGRQGLTLLRPRTMLDPQT